MGEKLGGLLRTLLVSLALVLGSSVLAPIDAAAAPTVDASKADAVRAAYREYTKLAQTPVGWTGSVASCAPGTVSAAYQSAILRRVNLVRGLAGLEPVQFSPSYSASAQAAALIMAANDTLEHYPAAESRCYSEAGATAAGKSNLAISWGLDALDVVPDPIQLYMDDYGYHNTAVGHRWWILRPETTTMGSGSTNNTNALWVIDESPRATAPQLTTWPVAGYFPSEWVPTSRRWSIQATGTARLSAATVRVTGPTGELAARVIYGAADRLVWEMPELPEVEGQGSVRYAVTVSGITGDGAPRTHTYNVDVIDGSWVDVYTTPGEHHVGGRDWRTTCQPYSTTQRCRTEIRATQIALVDGRYVQRTGWVFNNLTYLPSPRSIWKDNPLGGYAQAGYDKQWTSEGRAWRTECDTATSGRNGCRAYIRSTVIEVNPAGGYRTVTKWVFNNIVRFG
ncbi:hypothetical protein GCM10028820_03370 [Tessaracoccus terricola]